MDIYVDPAVHGRGVGTEAVRTLARHLIDEHGHHRLTIDPAADNPAAIRCVYEGRLSPRRHRAPRRTRRRRDLARRPAHGPARRGARNRRGLTTEHTFDIVPGTSLTLPPPCRDREGSVFEEVRTAVAALERAARDLDPALIDGPGAANLLQAFGRGERVCAAAKALLARRVDETGAWRGDGHRSAAHWVADATGETVGAAARTLETARVLGSLPETDAAFRSGMLSETQAAEITSAAASDPSAEAALLEAASSTSVKGLRDRCRETRAGVEENDGAWARRLHVERRAHEWTDPDGAYRLDARLPPDAGARFSSAWRAHIDHVFC